MNVEKAIPYPLLCSQHSLSPVPEAVRLIVRKAARELEVWQDETRLVIIPVIIGRSPVGHKQREGDLKTPEGDYAICYRNQESRFHRFLGLTYPNVQDAERGLAKGLIEATTCESIRQAIACGECPDWYTPLGGEVGIHGGGINREGTAGCVAMENDWIDVLWECTLVGTPVSILP